MQVSIIIPCHNGGLVLKKTLEAIYRQKTDKQFEVILLDSSLHQDEITKKLREIYPVRWYQIAPSDFNHGGTRDFGASKSQGEFLIFINKDATPATEDWLELMLQPMIDNQDVYATQGGIWEEDTVPRFFWHCGGSRFNFTSEAAGWMARYFHIGFSTVNCAIRKSVWEKYPFGRTDICEDKKFQKAVHTLEKRIVYAKGRVYHTHDYNYREIKNLCENYGYGWRLMNENYQLQSVVRDMLIMRNYKELWIAFKQRRRLTFAAWVYPVMRPMWIYKGNHYNKSLCK